MVSRQEQSHMTFHDIMMEVDSSIKTTRNNWRVRRPINQIQIIRFAKLSNSKLLDWVSVIEWLPEYFRSSLSPVQCYCQICSGTNLQFCYRFSKLGSCYGWVGCKNAGFITKKCRAAGNWTWATKICNLRSHDQWTTSFGTNRYLPILYPFIVFVFQHSTCF